MQIRWMKITCTHEFWLFYIADFEHVAELVVWIIFVLRRIFWNSSSMIQLEVLLLCSYPDKWMKNTCNRKFWLLHIADFENEAELVVWIIFVRRGIIWNTSSTIQLEVLQLLSYADKVNENHVQPQILNSVYSRLWTRSSIGGLNHLCTTRDFLKHV